MSTKETQQTIDDYIGVMVEGGDFGRFFTDDVEMTVFGSPSSARGRADVVELIRVMHMETFDSKPELKAVLAGERDVAVEVDFVGTHTGPMGDLPATGRSVRVPYAVFYDLDGDKIKALRVYGLGQDLVHQVTS